MGVLRQKLTEREEERGLLERKVTELSATVSSTFASYTFLEQALAAETTKYEHLTTYADDTYVLRIIKVDVLNSQKYKLCCFRLQQSWKDIQLARERANE